MVTKTPDGVPAAAQVYLGRGAIGAGLTRQAREVSELCLDSFSRRERQEYEDLSLYLFGGAPHTSSAPVPCLPNAIQCRCAYVVSPEPAQHGCGTDGRSKPHSRV